MSPGFPESLIDIPADAVVQRAILDRLGIGELLTPEQQSELEQIRRAQYVLVRNDGPERLLCGRCGHKHAHLTLMCKERPFRGIEHGLYAYYSHVGARAAESQTPEQRRRLDALAPVFAQVHQARPFADAHPETARKMGIGDDDEDLCAVLLGTLEPIDRLTANRYATIINMRAGYDLVAL